VGGVEENDELQGVLDQEDVDRSWLGTVSLTFDHFHWLHIF